MPRAVEAALFRQRPIFGNPVGSAAPALLDHLPLLQVGRAARHLEQRYGIRTSAVAVGEPAQFDVPTIPLALAGAGTRHAVIAGAGVDIPWVLTGPEGSTVHVAPGGLVGDMRSLQMATGGAAMARAVEQWLARLEPPSVGRRASSELSAFVIGTNVDEIGELAVRTAVEWNARYAYPRIVLDGSPPPPESFAPLASGAAPSVAPASVTSGGWAQDNELVMEAARARLAERSRRADAIVACLADAMVIAARDLDGIGQRLATQVPGTLVFNPSPFTRTDLARFPDGVERLVTDVPANGYAFIPGVRGDAVEWRDEGRGLVATGAALHVGLDGESGAIASLRGRADGTEWVRAGGAGLNGLAEARVERAQRLVLPGVATRLVVDRRGPRGQLVRSSVTAYDALPWVDVVNESLGDGEWPRETVFATAIEGAAVEWEIPAGRHQAIAPVAMAWLRWIRLSGEQGALLLGGLETPVAAVGEEGTVVVQGITRAARYRLAVQVAGRERFLEEPWRHGWSMEPLLTAPVSGLGRMALPSFGSLIQTSDPGAPIIGLELEDDHTVLVYIQEVIGVARPVTVQSAVLTFGEARLSDLVGRDRAPLDARDGTVVIELRPRGVAVVKLLRLGVRAG
jgi:hypothetical protein